ncbi:uncharacterized protein E0L32_004976 [Thyridium curvatum]|uniref:HMG box domain-containing protein n=1 Tax=Thyridium curvatum TaxID=1093900 RepID=A0A507B532_9PEZI|nr:uncharacterized protein E0L32_004976 [Thyridium curvatum]TPX14867.1 hypothetical protein E0L32_004976 [Thyridium curvatum]
MAQPTSSNFLISLDGEELQVSETVGMNYLLQAAFALASQKGADVNVHYSVAKRQYRISRKDSGLNSDLFLLTEVKHMDPVVAEIIGYDLSAEMTTEMPGTPVNTQGATTNTAAAASAIDQPHERIPRPKNAWIIYRQNKSKQLRKVDNTLTAAEISRIVSKMWKNEKTAVRQYFANLAADEDAKHKELYPNYRYNATRAARGRARAPKQLLSAHELHTDVANEVLVPSATDLAVLFGAA